MEELIKYIQSVETRLAALEAAKQAETAQTARIDLLNAHIVELKTRNADLETRVTALTSSNASLQERIAQMETCPATDVDENGNPQVEVEFVYEEESEKVQEKGTVAKPINEELNAPLPIVEDPIAEPIAAPKEKEESPYTETKVTVYGKPIKDIRKGINIADRYLFQKELFDSKGELMEKTLEKIQKMTSFDEAKTYIDTTYSWDKNSQTYELFTNLLHRRFN